MVTVNRPEHRSPTTTPGAVHLSTSVSVMSHHVPEKSAYEFGPCAGCAFTVIVV